MVISIDRISFFDYLIVMGEKDHLHALVKSMKKAEQSYFKKIKAAFGIVNSSLLQIFSALQNQEKYDEEELLNKLDKETFREFYAVKKHSLYTEILDVLVYSKARASEAHWQIQRMYAHALILKERMLFEDAYRILQKAKKLSEENEFFFKENEINQQLIEILNQHKKMTDFSFSESVESLRLNIIRVNEKSINAEQYFILSDQLYRKGETLRLTRDAHIVEEMRELYLSPLLTSENKALSKTALVCYHFIMYFKYNNYDVDHEKACYHIKELIELQAKIKRFTPRARVVQMGNYIILSTKIKQHESAFEMLGRMKEIFDEQNDDFIFMSYLSHLGICLLKSGKTNELDAFVHQLETTHRKKLDSFSFSKEMMDIKHLLFCYYFRKGDFKKAYFTASFLDGQFDIHSFKQMKFTEKVLKLLCAIELEDLDLIQAELRASKYILKGLENTLELELHVFETLDRLIKAKNKTSRNIVLEQYLQKFNPNLKDKKYSFLIEGFGFHKWAESKLKGHEFMALNEMDFVV